ncbi:MAG: hypothetical protein ABI543_08155 [Ignavibacteria bacterium]
MKYFINLMFAVVLTLAVSLTFAQGANGRTSNSVSMLNVIKTNNSVSYIKEDLNSDGRFEILKGGKIIKTAANEYWVHNTSLMTQNGDVITFNDIIKKNDISLIDQITAEYGYVLVFIPGDKDIVVYIAGSFGSKNSDSFSLPMY